MRLFITVLVVATIISDTIAPPVDKKVKTKQTADFDDDENILDELEYSRYLKEVVDILETDPEFKKKIENASSDDIKSGNVAEHLSLVQHNVRTLLDEAKQREITRLRHLVTKKFRNLNDRQRLALTHGDRRAERLREFLPQHVDHDDTERFSEKDLEKLIRKATMDLDEIDRKRQQQFKQYELRKEYQRRAKLAKLNAEERERLEKRHQETIEKKKRHRKVNHPGSVDQMEEVWEKVDHLEPEQFTARSFFQLHDINSDGFIDEAELQAIMMKEAEKIHDEMPEGDPIEKQEEMDRMRDHVMREFDKNKDRMLSLDEFEHGMNGTEAKNDQGWQSLEDKPMYSDQEYQEFSQKMAPMSTPIPAHQIISPTKPQSPAVEKAPSDPVQVDAPQQAQAA